MSRACFRAHRYQQSCQSSSCPPLHLSNKLQVWCAGSFQDTGTVPDLPGLSGCFDMQGCLKPLPQTCRWEAMLPHEPGCMLSHGITSITRDLSHFLAVHFPSYE